MVVRDLVACSRFWGWLVCTQWRRIYVDLRGSTFYCRSALNDQRHRTQSPAVRDSPARWQKNAAFCRRSFSAIEVGVEVQVGVSTGASPVNGIQMKTILCGPFRAPLGCTLPCRNQGALGRVAACQLAHFRRPLRCRYALSFRAIRIRFRSKSRARAAGRLDCLF